MKSVSNIPWGAQTEDSNVAHSATIPCLLQHDYKSTTIREVPHRKPPPPILPCSVLSFSCTLIPCHSFFTLHISLPFPETSTFIFLSTRSFLPILEHVILYPIKLRKWKHTHTHTHLSLLSHFFSEISSSLSCALEGRSSRMFSPVQVSNTV